MDIKEFSDKYQNVPQVCVPGLTKGTIVYLITERSVYVLEIISPPECKAIAYGGYFKERNKEPCETFIIGSTPGGSMLHKGKLIEGLCCEFENSVITSVIKKIFINYIN
ncbi:MAG: hypothetical protein WCJ01_10095 [Ignavibacteria bacterium]